MQWCSRAVGRRRARGAEGSPQHGSYWCEMKLFSSKGGASSNTEAEQSGDRRVAGMKCNRAGTGGQQGGVLAQ